MFIIGDKVVYPMHGAGTIEAIEEKQILGESKQYYVVNVPFGDMKIMVPVDSCASVGVREVISFDEMKNVLKSLTNVTSIMPSNWNRRYRENMEKLKTGETLNVAEVVRNLMRIDRIKKLSTGEKKMLANAKQILISEITLIIEEEPEIVEAKIQDMVWNSKVEAEIE